MNRIECYAARHELRAMKRLGRPKTIGGFLYPEQWPIYRARIRELHTMTAAPSDHTENQRVVELRNRIIRHVNDKRRRERIASELVELKPSGSRVRDAISRTRITWGVAA